MRRAWLVLMLAVAGWIAYRHLFPGPARGSAAYQQCIKYGIGTPEGCKRLMEP